MDRTAGALLYPIMLQGIDDFILIPPMPAWKRFDIEKEDMLLHVGTQQYRDTVPQKKNIGMKS